MLQLSRVLMRVGTMRDHNGQVLSGLSNAIWCSDEITISKKTSPDSK